MVEGTGAHFRYIKKSCSGTLGTEKTTVCMARFRLKILWLKIECCTTWLTVLAGELLLTYKTCASSFLTDCLLLSFRDGLRQDRCRTKVVSRAEPTNWWMAVTPSGRAERFRCFIWRCLKKVHHKEATCVTGLNWRYNDLTVILQH